MRKALLALSPSAFSAIDKTKTPGDCLVVGPGMNLPECGDWKSVDSFSIDEDFERCLAEGFMDIVEAASDKNDVVAHALFPHSNDFLAYVVRPLGQLIWAVRSILEDEEISVLQVFGPKKFSKSLAYFLMRTPEIQSGSPDLFGAVAVRHLRELFLHNSKIEFVEVSQSFISSSNSLRGLLTRLMSTGIGFVFLGKILWLRRRLGKINADHNDSAACLLVRAHHQARFANTLIAEARERDKCFKVLFIPQFAFGSTAQVYDEIGGSGTEISVPYLRDVLVSLTNAYFLSVKLRRLAKRESRETSFAIADLKMVIKWSDLVSEISSMPVLLVYPFLVERSVKRLGESVDKIVTFELVGRQALFERQCADRLFKRLIAVQTILVSKRPHVIFPVADTYFADSPVSAVNASSIGVYKCGNVVYKGAPYATNGNVVDGEEMARNIVFFSQPYEFSVTLSILEFLSLYFQDSSAVVWVKLHPRDDIGLYEKLLESNPGLRLLRTMDVNEAMGWADVVVSRTSSVLKEAVFKGVPTIACLWSSSDRRINVDYLSPYGNNLHIAKDEKQLAEILNLDSSVLNKAAKEFKEHIFGKYDLGSLVDAITS